MMSKQSILALLSVIVAIGLPLLNAIKTRADLQNNPVIKVKIEAYDPRDILYGHYMTYRYVWNWKNPLVAKSADTPFDLGNFETCKDDTCCLCVGEGDDNPVVELQTCQQARQNNCTHVIEGTYNYGHEFTPRAGTKYFVDEQIGYPLEDLFRDAKEQFRIGLSIAKSGNTMIEKLYIDGKTLSDYIREHPGKFYPKEETEIESE